MEPVLNESQGLLRASAVRLCQDLGGPKRARELRNSGSEADPAAWRELAQAGWLGTAVPEDAGGTGLGMFEVSLLLEQAGHRLLASPLIEASAAAWVIAHSRHADASLLSRVISGATLLVPALAQESWSAATSPPPVARAQAGAFRLSGKVAFVPYAPSAQAFLLAAEEGGEALLCVARKDAPGVSICSALNVDGSTSSELVFQDASVAAADIVARGSRALELAAKARELLALGTGAELIGVAGAALELTLDYLKLRHQFGKPLGSFQALQHRAADCFVDLELNRSLVYRVFAAWDAGQYHPAMVSAVKARTTRAALETARAALQLHGAIGYTDEHDIGLYYKRAVVLAARYGNEINHTGRFSSLTLSDD